MRAENSAHSPNGQGEPRRMRLLDWTRVDKGALIGRAKILLPCQLEIADVGIFAKDGRRWAQLPACAMPPVSH